MWDTYVALVTGHPVLAAFVQFGLLGTAGESLGAAIRAPKGANRSSAGRAASRLLLKMGGWGLLGVYIKAMFVTAGAGVEGLIGYGLLPGAAHPPGFVSALATSTLMNVMLGPSMVLIHRVIDNGIDRVLGVVGAGWSGLSRSLWTLIWLWIPVHSFTFMQVKEVRIGVAAALSMLLGVVLSLAGRTKAPA